MKTLGTLVLIILYHTTYSQQTTLITKNRGDYYEEYSVLQTDKKIKHGSYFKLKKRLFGGYAIITNGTYINGQKDGYWETYYGESNNIKEKGFYNNGLRDSIWVMYYPEGNYKKLAEVQSDGGTSLQIADANPVICKTGKFRNDKFTGIWEYFNESGEVSQKYDYDNGVVILIANQNNKNYDAGFIGGDFLLYQHLYDTFDFDGLMKSINSKISLETGMLKFKFTINENGLIKDINCSEQTINNKKIYNRALETIQSLNGHLYPKKIDGYSQSAEKTITFDLNAKSSTSHSSTEKFMFSRTSLSFNLKITVDN